MCAPHLRLDPRLAWSTSSPPFIFTFGAIGDPGPVPPTGGSIILGGERVDGKPETSPVTDTTVYTEGTGADWNINLAALPRMMSSMRPNGTRVDGRPEEAPSQGHVDYSQVIGAEVGFVLDWMKQQQSTAMTRDSSRTLVESYVPTPYYENMHYFNPANVNLNFLPPQAVSSTLASSCSSSSPRGRRIDPTRRLSQQDIPPCNAYYLTDRCTSRNCKYAHDYELNEQQLVEMRAGAKHHPCNAVAQGFECPEGQNCIYGHWCPRGRRCNRKTCDFDKLELTSLLKSGESIDYHAVAWEMRETYVKTREY